MTAVSTPEKGLARRVLDEQGVPTCAEDAAEQLLRRCRDRSRYARWVNPVLTALRLSPYRELDVVTYAGAATMLVALVITGIVAWK